jgi:phosphatidate cytidylyltransferase
MPAASRATRRRAARHQARSDLLGRVAIALPAVIFALVLVDVGGLPWALFMIALGWLCLAELYRMLHRWKPVALIGYLALAGMCLGARHGSERDVLVVALAAVPLLFAAVVARGQRRAATVAIAGTLLGIYWIGFGFACAVLLRELPHGKGVLIDVMIGTFIGDTGAYIGGKLFGRRPLAIDISPHKTVEGLFCGMVAALVTVVLASLYQPWMTRGDALILGVAIAILGPVGDLFESLVKRDAGVKDAGTLLGPHGGVLDRLDAIIFTVVAAYFLWVWLPH